MSQDKAKQNNHGSDRGVLKPPAKLFYVINDYNRRYKLAVNQKGLEMAD
jgi:hypothetical protein